MKSLVTFCTVATLLGGAALAQDRDPSSFIDPGNAPRGGAVDMIEDGSFEGGSPSSFWTESSTNFGTPLCTVGLCGDGGGTTGPRTGDWWAWFGGIAVPETGTVSQNVQISGNSSATLEFWFWNGTCGADGEFLALEVDGNEEWRDECFGERGDGSGYSPVSVDLSAYADGGNHVIEFTSTTGGGGGTTNYSLDDVTLTVAPAQNIIEVPTAGTVGLGLLALLIAGAAVFRLRG